VCIWSWPRIGQARLGGGRGAGGGTGERRAGCRRMLLLLTRGAGTGFEFGLCRAETAPPRNRPPHNRARVCTRARIRACTRVARTTPHATFPYSKSASPRLRFSFFVLEPSPRALCCSRGGGSRENGGDAEDSFSPRRAASPDNIYSPSTPAKLGAGSGEPRS